MSTISPPTWAPPSPPPPPAPETPRSSSKALKVTGTLAVLGLAVSVFTIGSLALFTDTAVVPSNTFTTGNVDITTNSDGAALFTPPAMAPGDQVTRPITVTNAGSLELRYALTSTITAGDQLLADALQLTVKVGVSDCSNPGFGSSGTVISPAGKLGDPDPGRQIFGDVATGAQTGDRVLATTVSETLCLNVVLPGTADNSTAGKTTTARFDFVAEQTTNN